MTSSWWTLTCWKICVHCCFEWIRLPRSFLICTTRFSKLPSAPRGSGPIRPSHPSDLDPAIVQLFTRWSPSPKLSVKICSIWEQKLAMQLSHPQEFIRFVFHSVQTPRKRSRNPYHSYGDLYTSSSNRFIELTQCFYSRSCNKCSFLCFLFEPSILQR